MKIMKINIWDKKLKDIEDFLLEVHFKYRKTNYTFNTGEFGMLLFNKAIVEKLKDYSVINQKFTPFDTNKKLEKGSHFVIYSLPNGIEIKIQHDPNLDKKEDVNEFTGFPNKSSTLYCEES